jgi:hypothetical protein
MRMRKATPVFFVIGIVALLVVYGSAVGFSAPVDDFEQPDDTTPADTYVAPIDDHSTLSPSLPTPPVIWWSVNFDFIISNLGIINPSTAGDDFTPRLRVDSLTVNQELYISYLEGRIVKNEKLSLWNPPHIPSMRSWAVHIEVYGNVIPFTASWVDTVTHQASDDVFEISGSSGRVFISQPGTYIAEIMCVDISNGHTYGFSSTTFVVANYWA